MSLRGLVGIPGICFLSILQCISTLAQCPASIYSVFGHHLGNHVMSSKASLDLSGCIEKCSEEFYCRSINYGILRKSCDLNSADRYSHPQDYGPREGYVYMDGVNRRRGKKGGFKSCAEIQQEYSSAQSGYYWIVVKDSDVQVYCDMKNYDGGWTLVVSISSKNNDHLQRNANNCWSPKLCVLKGDPNVIEARKMNDEDIRKLAATHEVFDAKDNRECGFLWKSSLYIAIGMPGLREVLQAKWPRPGLEPETLDPGAPIFVFNVNHDTGEVEVEECVYFLHFYGDETDGKFRGKAVSFSTIIRNLQLQATHSELAAALAEVGNPDENAEH
ncbi:hypothetical protein ACROYT_G016540 [Oculina patagonica]